MTGFRLFLATLRCLLKNFWAALRVSILPVVVFFAGAALAVYLANVDGRGGAARAAMSLIIALGVFTVIWLAVNWHRHLLTEDRARWLPRLAWRDMAAYLVQLIPVAIVVVMVAIALAWVVMPFVIRTIMQSDAELSLPFVLWIARITAKILGVILGALILRLGATLPAAAIGATVGGVWSAMRSAWGTLLILSAFLTASQVCLSWLVDEIIQAAITSAYASHSGTFEVIALSGLAVIIGVWLSGLLYLTALSVVYARYVQGRTLA